MDDKNILISSEESCRHHHYPHPYPHHFEDRKRKRHFLVGLLFVFLVIFSYILILGASFGITQQNSLLHGNHFINSSIIIKIIVNGKNETRHESITATADTTDVDSDPTSNWDDFQIKDIGRLKVFDRYNRPSYSTDV